ncbi:MAG: DUF2244 domain-containing protein [Marinibacterium sp.]|nr:DUF2244 domain-containing protein [Marinibacterium sp.]
MPYEWISTHPDPDRSELHLWPHQSLQPRGFVLFIAVTSVLLLVPLVPLVGSVVIWGVLPFMLLALAGIWFALEKSWRDRRILEVLTLTEDQAHLVRHNPRGPTQEWGCNRYWASAEMHEDGGPVPYYVTLKGGGREVEIGCFLSEDERQALYSELLRHLR